MLIVGLVRGMSCGPAGGARARRGRDPRFFLASLGRSACSSTLSATFCFSLFRLAPRTAGSLGFCGALLLPSSTLKWGRRSSHAHQLRATADPPDS